MDFSYIEDESIHIRPPYQSNHHFPINLASDLLDESDHPIDESENHHRYIPYWRLIPSKSIKPSQSRPNTSVILTPLKKHLLEDSVILEDEAKVNEDLIDNSNFSYYGQTGKIVFRAFNCETNLENRIIEEYLKDPGAVAGVGNECLGVVEKEYTMLSKILIDLMVEYWKGRDRGMCGVWVKVGKEFYGAMELPIFTNFVQEGILHFEEKEDYLEYFDKVLLD